MKVRTFMPLVAAALIAVLMLALGAGTGAAKSDVQAAPAKYKVALVTDIGGLDDRSFNFLANKGLSVAKKKLGVDGSVFISKSGSDYVPNLTRAARNGSGLVIGVGFLMADAVAQVAKRFPKTKFAIIDNSGVAAELKGKPTNVRGLLFKEQEAGYLVGFLAAKQIVAAPFEGQTKLGAVGGLKIPPVDRFIAGYYAGAKRASSKVTVDALLLPGLRRPGEVQGAGAEPDRQRRRRRLPGRRPVRSRRPLGGEGEGCLRHRRRRRPGLPRLARDDERHEEGRRRGLQDDRGGEGRPRRCSRTNFNAIFTVANGGVGYGKISLPDLAGTWEAGLRQSGS